MERLSGREHHVVGDVDDVRDRALAGRHQPLLQPQGRGTDLHILEDARGEAQADLRVDLDRGVVVDRVASAGLGVGLGRVLGQRCAGHRMQISRDPVDAHDVRPVGRYLELQHLVGYRQVIGERRADREALREHHDPVMVLADADLVLGEDHPGRRHPAQLGLAERAAVGHHRTRQRHGHGLTRRHVGRAGHDRLRLAAPDVHCVDVEPVGVRVLPGCEDTAREERRRVPHAGAVQPLELVARQRQRVGDLLGREPGIAIGAQPGDRDPHPNCSSSRRSFS